MTSDNSKSTTAKIGKHIQTRLVSGLLALIPLAITVFIVNLFFSSLTAFVRPLMRPWLDDLPEYVLTLTALAATVVLIYLVGVITTFLIGRRLIHWGESLLLKLPIVKSVYAASKQVVDTLSSSSKAAFKAVTFVEFPRRGSLAIGFVTGTMRGVSGQLLYRVFIATTPNPTSGFLLILPEADIQFTDISVEDGLKMIVSGGMLAPENYSIHPPPGSLKDEGEKRPAQPDGQATA